MNQNIKIKTEKANEIVAKCNTKLGVIRKKQNEVIGNYHKVADNHKIEKIKKQIEAL